MRTIKCRLRNNYKRPGLDRRKLVDEIRKSVTGLLEFLRSRTGKPKGEIKNQKRLFFSTTHLSENERIIAMGAYLFTEQMLGLARKSEFI